MTFLFPLGLLSLVALPVIVWLHMRRQKLKRVVVPSLLHWAMVPFPSSQAQRRKLPITLLLLVHLLIAGLLALALGHPQIFGWMMQTRRHFAVIVDTSTSMGASDMGASTRLQDAADDIRTMIGSMGGQDRLTLIEAGSRAHMLAAGDLGSHAGLLLALDSLEAGGNGTDIAGALTLARTMLQVQYEGQAFNDRRIVVLSDLERPPDMPALEYPVDWQRIGANPDNRAIVAFAATAQGRTASAGHHLYARVANYSDRPLSTRLRLLGDNNLIDTHLLVLQPESEMEYTWDLPAGYDEVRAEVDGEDVLPVDDRATLSLGSDRLMKTLLVSENPDPLERLLTVLPGLSLVALTPEEYSHSPLVETADLTIFDGTLAGITDFPAGGVLINNPPPGDTDLLQVGPAEPVTGTLYTEMPSDMNAGLLDELGLESVDFGPIARVSPPGWAGVALAADGVPFIVRGRVGQSEVAIWTFDVHELATRLAFPLLLARTVQDLSPPPLPASLLVGTPLMVQTSLRADEVELRRPDGQSRMFSTETGETAFLLDDLTQPGLYTLLERSDGEVIYEGRFAVNTGSPLESDLRARPPAVPGSALQAVSPTPAEAAQTQTTRQEQVLWSWLTLAALGILVLEWIYYVWSGKKIQKPESKPVRSARGFS